MYVTTPASSAAPDMNTKMGFQQSTLNENGIEDTSTNVSSLSNQGVVNPLQQTTSPASSAAPDRNPGSDVKLTQPREPLALTNFNLV